MLRNDVQFPVCARDEVNARLGDVAPRVARLAARDGDDLCADVREGGLRHDGPPRKEPALGPCDAIELVERTGILPVAEADAVVVGAAAEVEDDAEDDEAGDRDDLDGGEDEFCLAVCRCEGVSVNSADGGVS